MSTEAFTESWLEGPKATQFYTRTYPASTSPPKAVVVFVHGFAEHIGRYSHFHPILASRGISVFAYDQRGFGLTGQDTTGKKSKSSAYGKTSWKEQMLDIDWALGHVKTSFKGVPIFLMGHSMGGGEVLGFCAQGENGPYKSTLSSLSGVISTSPLILTTTPAPKFQLWIGSKLSAILPSTLIPVGVKAEQLSHDPEVNGAYLKDPLVKQSGSLKGVSDMLANGEKLLSSDYANWPKYLPVLILHGTEDKVTSHKASKELQSKLPADFKELSLYEGGFHELQNEPDGVKEKLADEIIAFIEKHLSTSATYVVQTEMVPVESSTEPTIPTEASVEPTGVSPARAKM
ncbi:Putative monoglyceride lipase [Psilocybe cubensis]|uniref:Monoglyceride lipase n=2 Tax=Psilocybe cubensis TaxID=181762 RepID=A0ACB8HEK1_PSICU|nr:Putative monoglyceride lipase [Psilocybe cubensis]KAH9485599.1 Putative monoglyceride lipase [Psilocybe cubensis]